MPIWQAVVEYRLNDSIEEACRENKVPFRVWHIDDHLFTRKLVLRFSIEATDIAAIMEPLQKELLKLTTIVGESEILSLRFHPDRIPEQIPQLVGLADIAKMLGRTRQRAKQLAASPRFPKAVAYTPSTGNLYLRYAIKSWIDDREQGLNWKKYPQEDFPVQRLKIFTQPAAPPDWLTGRAED
ncbi:hypothetical protein [Actinoplanes missouriensis]|uniref:hypothetical protein n=1 Tax=Actinoplanes missouriensis TaxID=1866 RepID=UPI0012F9AC50|nr:hypothetical protein [Actinoplanes missouriensis]